MTCARAIKSLHMLQAIAPEDHGPHNLIPPVFSLDIVKVQAFDDRIICSVTDGLRFCGNCGICAFGLEPAASHYRRIERLPGVNDRATVFSPIAASLADGGPGCVWHCKQCRRDSTKLQTFAPTMTTQYAKALATLPYEVLHSNAFIDVCYRLTTHAYGYVTGEFDHHSLVPAPLLAGVDPGGLAAAEANPHLAYLQEYLAGYHVGYQEYVPLRYRLAPRPLMLQPAAWQHIIERQRQRDPVESRDHEAHPQLAALDVHANNAALPSLLTASVGAVEDADTGAVAPVMCSSGDLLYNTMEADVLGRREPVESLLFPAFFPHSDGVYRKHGKRSFTADDYLKLRCRQAFTPFCKQAAYLLLLRSIANTRRALTDEHGAYIINAQAFKRAEEEADVVGEGLTNHALLRNLVKQRVSSKIEGSPASFRRSKQDLDAMVRELGLPHYFATVTMHETGEGRAPEYACIDGLMKTWDPSFSWQARPCMIIAMLCFKLCTYHRQLLVHMYDAPVP